VFLPQQSFDKDAVLEQALNADISDIQFVPNTLSDDGRISACFSLMLSLTNAFCVETAASEMIVTDIAELGLLQDATSQLELVGSSQLAYLPLDTISLSEEDAKKNWDLIEGFEELDDVDVVYHNIKLE